jgi:NAD(P)H-nitrite reductase large subunit
MHIAIIGNGISGITAARFIRKLSNHDITVISSESKHFYSRTALMYIYMGHMKQEDTQPYEDWFWKKNRINLVFDRVDAVNTSDKLLQMQKGEAIQYDKLIIATGSKSNKFGWPGQDLDGVSGLYNLQDLETIEKYSKNLKRAVIIGGGLIGIELAEMFHARHIPVTMLVRENNYWNNILPDKEATMITNHVYEHGIDLRLSSELKEILPDENGQVRAIITKDGEEIECGFVGLTAGVSPNIDFIKNSDIETGRGILVNEYLETNIPDVYAIGDCAAIRNPVAGRRPIEAIWYTGKMMGETVAYNICGKEIKYVPRLWFNSAKFLDIEYQVYGDVQNTARTSENHAALYWEHADGKKAIRIMYEKEGKTVVGFNLMGIRYRHEVCEKWLNENTKLETVLSNLGLANFDPEFYKQYETALVKQYNEQTNSDLTLETKRNATAALSFIGVRPKRFDSNQEAQPLAWHQTKTGKLTALSMFLIFAVFILAYYYMRLTGVLYALPVIGGLVYLLMKQINNHQEGAKT